MSGRRPWMFALLVAATAFAVQAIALRDVLLWDDVLLLRRTDLYTSASRWTESVTTPLGRETFYWRPAATTSFLLETWLHGGAAWAHRATSALVHAAACATAFVLLLRLLGRTSAALLASLVFAVHPVGVEAVTWISARFDLLASLFTLGALAFLPRDAATWGRLRPALVGLAALLAACSKESAFVVPLLAAAWSAALCGDRRTRVRALLSTGAGVALSLFLRYEALGYVLHARDASVAAAGGPFQHLLLVGRAFATDLRLLVVPWDAVGPLHTGPRPVPAGDATAWFGLVTGVALVAAMIVLLARGRRSGWLLAAFLVSLAPSVQLVPLDLSGALDTADRFLYLPLFFAVALGGLLAVRPIELRPGATRAVAMAGAALVLALAAGRLAILPRWNDSMRFWRWAVEMAPAADVAQTNLALEELLAEDYAGAADHAARGGRPGLVVLVEALRRQGRVEEALRALDRAAAAGRDAEALVLRGELRLAQGRAEDARRDFAAAQIADKEDGPRFEPLAPRILAGSAACDALLGRVSEAREEAARAEAMHPEHPHAWTSLARTFLALREFDRAREMIDRAQSADAWQPDVDALRAQLPK